MPSRLVRRFGSALVCPALAARIRHHRSQDTAAL
jgi:hypothetical protein